MKKIKKKKRKKRRRKKNEEKKTEQNIEEGKLILDKFIDTVLDLYFIKCHSFYIYYTTDDLKKIQDLEPELENIEDIFKLENMDNYNEIVDNLIKSTIEKDESLPLIIEAFNKTGNQINIKEIMIKILKKLFTDAKTTKEFNANDKIKLILIFLKNLIFLLSFYF